MALILLVIAAVQIQITSYNAGQLIKKEAEEKLNGYYLAYTSRVAAESNAAGAMAATIAARSDVQELYLKNDREGLYALLQPMFEDMKKRQIVHLYIENPDGTVYLRVHKPASFGDDITYRGTASDALALKETTSGVEIGPSRLGVRGVAPMFYGNRFIGLIEVGLDFDQQFISDMKALTGADFTMWVTYDAAAPPKLLPVEGVPAAPIKEVFYYAGTSQQTLPMDAEVYRSVLTTGKSVFQTVMENTATPSIVYITPLLGYKNELFGLLEISTSYTKTLAALSNSSLTSLGLVAGLTLIGLLLIWVTTSRFVLKPLQSLTQFANRQLSGDTKTRAHVNSGDEFEQLANTFNSLMDSVEKESVTVANSTKALAISSEVSRRLSTILDPKQLMNEVVEQLQSAFNYYHAHIYLSDEASGDLIMAGGTGDVGQTLLARGHKVPKGRGLVGRAADTNSPVLVPDTSKDSNWLPNPLLPETKSEIAVPIAIGGLVLGVLDVQQNVIDGLSQDDVTLLQSTANQVAIALQNARSYEQTRSQAELESLINTIGRKIQRAGSVEDVLQTAIREVGVALGASRVSASLQPVHAAEQPPAAGGGNGADPKR
jgi:putative methionine-R-sulfoxide reductase with GAF domain